MFLLAYARFLSNNTTSRMRTMMIKTNNPAATGIKYMSAAEEGGSVDIVVGDVDTSRTAM